MRTVHASRNRTQIAYSSTAARDRGMTNFSPRAPQLPPLAQAPSPTPAPVKALDTAAQAMEDAHRLYAERADSFYHRAIRGGGKASREASFIGQPQPPPAPAGAKAMLRSSVLQVIGQRRSQWDNFFAKLKGEDETAMADGGQAASGQLEEMRARFHVLTKEALGAARAASRKKTLLYMCPRRKR